MERRKIFAELMKRYLVGVGTPHPEAGRAEVEKWSGVDRFTTAEVVGLFHDALERNPRLMPQTMQVLNEVTPAPVAFCATVFALGYLFARREAVQALEDAYKRK